MIRKQFLKITLILIIFTGFMTSCDKKDDKNKINIQIDKVIVNNDGEFIFKGSIEYIVNDTLQYQVKIQTNPADADIYYSKNENDFNRLSEDWITIDSTYKYLRFYAKGQNYNETDIYKINFGFGNDSTISTVYLYPNPFVDYINFGFKSKNIRDKYCYKVLDLTGKIVLIQNDFVTEDEIERNIDLKSLSSGIYLIQFDFGNTKLISKIVKR